MLLRLRVANHRSIRDEVDLSFLSGGFQGATPPDSGWGSALSRVTAIYGANGSGKSTILDAIDFIMSAVNNSATKWADRESFPYHPFELDEVSSTRPSLYEIDFAEEGVRYTFGFESNREGIVSEWLFSYPSSRRRTLYHRTGEAFKFGRSLGGEVAAMNKMTSQTALFISTAAAARHDLLQKLRHGIIAHTLYARFKPSDQEGRLTWLKDMLAKDDSLLARVQTVVGLADLGVADLSIRHEEMDPEERAQMIRMLKSRLAAEGIRFSDDQAEEAVDRIQVVIELGHSTGSRDPGLRVKYLPFDSESSGTVSWLSLLVPALHAVYRGLTLLIDEIDSSLHPNLTATLINIFDDPVINRRGGQLIFTSHDTALLGKNVPSPLKSDQVWFTEKRVDGSTDLYALEEFTNRAGDNIEKRYLDGRYGALPMVALDDLRAAMEEFVK